jgi:hypothetical protein
MANVNGPAVFTAVQPEIFRKELLWLGQPLVSSRPTAYGRSIFRRHVGEDRHRAPPWLCAYHWPLALE